MYFKAVFASFININFQHSTYVSKVGSAPLCTYFYVFWMLLHMHRDLHSAITPEAYSCVYVAVFRSTVVKFWNNVLHQPHFPCIGSATRIILGCTDWISVRENKSRSSVPDVPDAHQPLMETWRNQWLILQAAFCHGLGGGVHTRAWD